MGWRERERQRSVHIDTGECIRAFFHEASSRHQVGGGAVGEQDQSSVPLTRLLGPCPLVILVGRERRPTETRLALLEHPNGWKREPLLVGAEAKASRQPASAVVRLKLLFLNNKVSVVYPISTFPCRSARPPRLMVPTDASQILLDSSSTFPLRKKSPKHIAAVSQDERMMLAAGTGALPGFRLLFGPLLASHRVTCSGRRNAVTDVLSGVSMDSDSRSA